MARGPLAWEANAAKGLVHTAGWRYDNCIDAQSWSQVMLYSDGNWTAARGTAPKDMELPFDRPDIASAMQSWVDMNEGRCREAAWPSQLFSPADAPLLVHACQCHCCPNLTLQHARCSGAVQAGSTSCGTAPPCWPSWSGTPANTRRPGTCCLKTLSVPTSHGGAQGCSNARHMRHVFASFRSLDAQMGGPTFPPAVRRYLILYDEGGVYADSDVVSPALAVQSAWRTSSLPPRLPHVLVLHAQVCLRPMSSVLQPRDGLVAVWEDNVELQLALDWKYGRRAQVNL